MVVASYLRDAIRILGDGGGDGEGREQHLEIGGDRGDGRVRARSAKLSLQ